MCVSAESDPPAHADDLLPEPVTEPEWALRIRRLRQEQGERLRQVLGAAGDEEPAE